MDGASLALGVIALFKDTYLVGKFVYKTINSGLKHEEERMQVGKELRHELLLLQSFGRAFMDIKGMVTKDTALNLAWLEHSRDVLEDLRVNLAEYREAAEKNDSHYRQFSPTLNPDFGTSGSIEFDVDETLPVASRASFFNKLLAAKPFKDTHFYVAGDWALFRKRKLENFVFKFHKRNKQLQQILQTAVPAQILSIDQNKVTIERWMRNTDFDTLGLKGHMHIAQLQQGAGESKDLQIKNAEVSSDAQTQLIHLGSLRLSKARNNVQVSKVLLEVKQYGSAESSPHRDRHSSNGSQSLVSRTAIHVEKLASLLHFSGLHQLGTLPLQGYIHQPSLSRHVFVFNFPEGTDVSPPMDLNTVIGGDVKERETAPWPLAQRFSTAFKLATILGAFHNDGWVHKSIRTQSVAFFHDGKNKTLLLDDPYLVNFEYSRLHSRTTYLERDEDIEKDLYRHPSLQESNRQDSFTRVHDIYALGVVLLEIALWRTAAEMVDSGTSQEQRRDARAIRRLYLKIARIEVPWRMGTAYAEAIDACIGEQYAGDFVIPEREAFRKRVIENLSPKMLHKGWALH